MSPLPAEGQLSMTAMWLPLQLCCNKKRLLDDSRMYWVDKVKNFHSTTFSKPHSQSLPDGEYIMHSTSAQIQSSCSRVWESRNEANQKLFLCSGIPFFRYSSNCISKLSLHCHTHPIWIHNSGVPLLCIIPNTKDKRCVAKERR